MDLTTNNLQLISPAFNEGGTIPEQYTCKGEDVSPPLNIYNVPPETKSLVLIMHDPDAPGGDFLHWLVWDIQPNTETIPANSVPVGAVQGLTGFGSNKYGGPCPPSGEHHYEFDLYALNTTLGLEPERERVDVEDAMQGHILAQTKLTGLVRAA